MLVGLRLGGGIQTPTSTRVAGPLGRGLLYRRNPTERAA